MWYTTRYQGFDSDIRLTPGGSSLALAAFQTLSSIALRLGLILKLIAITGLVLSYYLFEGTGTFTYDLSATTEHQRENKWFQLMLVVFSGLYLLGAIYILAFQALLADDASWSRGYRSGSKLLSNGVFLDVVSSTLQFVIYVYMYCKYDKVWWVQFNSGGTEWLIHTWARILQAFSLYYYGAGLFLLEIYHDSGTNDWHGLLNAVLFTIASWAEILVFLTFLNGSVSIMFCWIALMSALVWGLAFEQEVNAAAPRLTEPELTNDIETQVEKLARASPYMKL